MAGGWVGQVVVAREGGGRGGPGAPGGWCGIIEGELFVKETEPLVCDTFYLAEL